MGDKEAIKRLADDLGQLEGWSLRSEAGRYYIANRLYHAGYRKVPSGYHDVSEFYKDEDEEITPKA